MFKTQVKPWNKKHLIYKMMCASVHIKVATDKREYPAAIPPLESEKPDPQEVAHYISVNKWIHGGKGQITDKIVKLSQEPPILRAKPRSSATVGLPNRLRQMADSEFSSLHIDWDLQRRIIWSLVKRIEKSLSGEINWCNLQVSPCPILI